MFKQFLLMVVLSTYTAAAASEQTIHSGAIYATVEMMPNGDLEVINITSDLPEELHPEIETWLQQQAIQFAAAAESEPPNRTTVHVDYSIIEDAGGGQGLVMMVKSTGVSAPEVVAAPVSLVDTEVPVAVKVNSDGRVASVEPLEELPRGIQRKEIEAAVRYDIENDSAIQQAARDGRLEEDEYTITVRVKMAEN